MVCAALSTFAGALTLALLVLATRRIRYVPGDCARPWHCARTVVYYDPITLVLAIIMLALLVRQLRSLVRFRRPRPGTPPPPTTKVWMVMLDTTLTTVPSFLVGGFFLMAVG